MSTGPSLPDQAMLHADRVFLAPDDSGAQTPEEDLVEDRIIEVPEDLGDPERAAVRHSEAEQMHDSAGSGSEFDRHEQTVELPDDIDEDERV